MYDLVSIGTVSVDLYFKGKSLPYAQDHFYLSSGGKYFVDFFHEGVGGGATNVAIGAKKNGLDVALMAKIGNNSFKSLIVDKLAQIGISTNLCQFLDDYFNVSTIFLNGVGEKTVVNYRTPHQHYTSRDSLQGGMFETKGIYIANMPDASVTDRTALLKEYKSRGVLIFMNLGVNDCRRPKEELEHLIRQTDILIVNTHEFSDLIKRPLHKINFTKTYVPNHWPALHDKTVVVTDGEHGSYSYHDGRVYFQKAIPPEKVVDTTGAGDGYTASFIAKYIRSKDIVAAMKKGAEYSSKKLEHLGAN